jgi:hypothetical protein
LTTYVKVDRGFKPLRVQSVERPSPPELYLLADRVGRQPG